MHRRLVSLKVISSFDSLSSPLGELAILERTPESMLRAVGVSIYVMTPEIFLVRKPFARAGWNVTLEW